MQGPCDSAKSLVYSWSRFQKGVQDWGFSESGISTTNRDISNTREIRGRQLITQPLCEISGLNNWWWWRYGSKRNQDALGILCFLLFLMGDWQLPMRLGIWSLAPTNKWLSKPGTPEFSREEHAMIFRRKDSNNSGNKENYDVKRETVILWGISELCIQFQMTVLCGGGDFSRIVLAQCCVAYSSFSEWQLNQS